MVSDNYIEYKKLLLKLHEFCVKGTDQTDEADKIRDAMDAPGYALTPLEHERVSGLSGDLYMLVNDEVKEKTNEPFNQRLFVEKCDAEDWDSVLAMMRKSNFPAPDAVVANMRALCWAELSDFDVSLLFAKHALKLDPNNVTYRATEVWDRLKLGETVEARELNEIFMYLFDLPDAFHKQMLQLGKVDPTKLLQPA